MRIAVLVKQIPVGEKARFEDGRLVREGVELEVSAYDRRANAKAVELVSAAGEGEVVVYTMGPPQAEDALREMVACGADRGVLVTDRAMAGADTLATARVLAAALRADGPWDLVLCGLYTVDADTGQVGPELAELLGLPFAAGVRLLDVDGDGFSARLETDDGIRAVEGPLPAVLSTAERLTDPSKAPPERGPPSTPPSSRRGRPPTSACPTPRSARPARRPGSGPPAWSSSTGVVRWVGWPTPSPCSTTWGPSSRTPRPPRPRPCPPPAATGRRWCFVEAGEHGAHLELVAEAARLAAVLGGSTVAYTTMAVPGLGAAGADRVVVVDDLEVEQWADVLATDAGTARPWALLVDGTRDGREVAGRVAARHGWGLTGDAIELAIQDGRLTWKPAFSGGLVASILTRSDVQMATVRPGVLPRFTPRTSADPVPEHRASPLPSRIRTLDEEQTGPDPSVLHRAEVVVCVGRGVDPDDYALLDPLLEALGAQLAATRKVTDASWLPRSLQVGITGHSLAPRLFVSIGASGKFNHTAGFQAAGSVLAINPDPDAPIWQFTDAGIVGDWKQVVPELVEAIRARTA